jgi:three-Cys-motif partner protein
VTLTPLEFVKDAISLSGLTGTKLKCDVIGTYYPFWWKITSGGKRENYQRVASIVELNAATGEVYIRDTDETVLGSAGHALELKVSHLQDVDIDTGNLKIILVEENPDCYARLKRVISRRWKEVPLEMTEGPISENSSNIYLFNDTLDGALTRLKDLKLGNAIFYSDPLRSVGWNTVERVARSRIKSPFQTGTEFIIFLFTSDWFLGRGGDFSPLPNDLKENTWTGGEKNSVVDADALFGGQQWRKDVLTTQSLENKENTLVTLYKHRLCSWFRYVLPMPFNPKKNQLFHVILCSNYEAGVLRTKSAYASKTLNLPYKPDNTEAYGRFIKQHPETTANLSGRQKPLEWKILWKVIKNHEGSTCDCYCKDFRENEPEVQRIQNAIEWLQSEGYLVPFEIENAWLSPLNRYTLDWKVIKQSLGVIPPSELHPLSPEEFAQTGMGKIYELLKKWRQAVSQK